MNPKHPVAGGIGQHFDKAVGVGIGAGARVGGERELADSVFDAGRLQLFLGLADRGDFRPGVDDRRDRVVIDLGFLPGQPLDDGDAFFLGLVRQHRPVDHVADRVEAGHIRCEVFADGNTAGGIARDADLVKPEPVGERPPPDCDQNGVRRWVTTIVVNRRGEITSRMNGFVPDRFIDMLSERIDEALK